MSNGISYVRAMALDWTTGNLYIIDTGRTVITVRNVHDKEMWQDVVTTDLLYPVSIAVNPNSG